MRCTCLAGILSATAVATLAIAAARADDIPPRKAPVRKDLLRRYGIEVDLKHYPQGDPRQAIRSVIRAVSTREVDYMLAHLISPTQVDRKLKGDQRAFRKLAAKATPEKSMRMIEALNRHVERGTWTIGRDLAWAETGGVPLLSLEKLGNRWFMHNVALPRERLTRRTVPQSPRR